MALREIGRVGGDAVGDHADLHVVAVGQAQMLLGRDVAEHGGAEPADHGGADRRGDVVVAGCDVGGERPEGVEGGFAAFGQLLLHVDLDLVHGHVARAFDHDLAALFPGGLGQFTKGFQFGELGGVVGVGVGAGAEAVAEREADVVFAHDVADLVEALVEEALLVVGQAPAGHDAAAAGDDAGDALRCQGQRGRGGLRRGW